MIKLVDNVEVYGLDESIKASKYPMSVDIDSLNGDITKTVKVLGSSDKGEGHDNFLNGIVVQFDLTFSNKAWVEAERYHFFDFVSSQSSMHKITKMNINQQCNKYVDTTIIKVLENKVKIYNNFTSTKPDKLWFDRSIDAEMYNIKNLEDYNNKAKEMYLEVLYNIPSGFQLTARMTTNYRQLKTIYYQRRNHRLPEWREFCKWIETLPYFKEICLDGIDKQ